jgi:hypothetical protein
MSNHFKLFFILALILIISGCSLFTPTYTKTKCQKSCLDKGFNSSTCIYPFDATANLEPNNKCSEPQDSKCFCYFQSEPKTKIPIIEEDKITSILNQIKQETKILFTLPNNANLVWDFGDEVDKYQENIEGKQIKFIGQYSLDSIQKALSDLGFSKNNQGYQNGLLVCQIMDKKTEINIKCGQIIEKPEITPLNELLDPDNQSLSKELKISGFASKINGLDCPCFELVNGDYKLKIWYDQLNEPKLMEKVLNRHLLHLSGELISYGDENEIPEFKIYNLQIIE